MRPEIDRLFRQADRDLSLWRRRSRHARHPDAANGVPYELYDEATVRTKLEHAEAVIAWLRRRIQS